MKKMFAIRALAVAFFIGPLAPARGQAASEIPSPESPEISKPTPRPKEQEASGLTCASCHLTPDGRIRGPYRVDAPHATVVEPAMQTAASCAYCHSLGPRVVGKQTQTFLEW